MRRQHLTSWLFVGALIALCAVLGFLQYRWIGEVSLAARERLRASLQANLVQLSLDFNSEISTACRGLMPSGVSDPAFAEAEIERRYEQWKTRAQNRQIVERVALAVPRQDTVALRVLNWETGKFQDASWPESWQPIRGRLESRIAGERNGGRDFGGQPSEPQADLVLETPLFPAPGSGPGPFPPFGRREFAWMLFDLDLSHIRNVILPEVVERHLGAGGALDYEVEVVTRSQPQTVIYASDPDATRAWEHADASVGLLDIRLMDGGGRGGRGGRGGKGRNMGGGGGQFDLGKWELFVQHRAGSLEAAVARARWRNLSVTAGVLLLLVVTLGALVRFTRNAQRLAQLQMDFVAGVSHELRTPLTALYTAGHNLRGRVAQQPSQVERYGEMIQLEAGRLKDLVEQVLRFAGANAGRIIQEPSPASIGKIVEETVEASRSLLQSAHCTVETHIDPNLPAVMADPIALRQAIQNLLTNAVKYGARESCWVGISAVAGRDGSVEVHVSDRGPGIPPEEIDRVFDAFYRGRRAIQDQVHGAGLGLNLVKKIVEAHGGTVRVESEPEKGAEFILRLPPAPLSALS